jgi:hypothetical protein
LGSREISIDSRSSGLPTTLSLSRKPAAIGAWRPHDHGKGLTVEPNFQRYFRRDPIDIARRPGIVEANDVKMLNRFGHPGGMIS